MSEPVGGIKKSTSTHARRVIAYIVLIILSILCLFWFYILLIYSTRSNGEIQKGITFIPILRILLTVHSLYSRA